jgi:DNA-binding MarR family transcriptional regulator
VSADTDTPKPDEVAAVAALRAAIRRFGQATDEIAARHGLTSRQYDLCLLLEASSEPVIAREVAGALHLSANATSELIARAERAGLIERISSPRDARSKPLKLTASGRRHFNAAFADLRPERLRLRTLLQDAVDIATSLLDQADSEGVDGSSASEIRHRTADP